MILRYVTANHTHPLRGKVGGLLARPDLRARKPLPACIDFPVARRVRNEGVLIDGRLVVAPWGNWRRCDA